MECLLGECAPALSDHDRGRLTGSLWAMQASPEQLEILAGQAGLWRMIARNDDYRLGWLRGALDVAEALAAEPYRPVVRPADKPAAPREWRPGRHEEMSPTLSTRERAVLKACDHNRPRTARQILAIFGVECTDAWRQVVVRLAMKGYLRRNGDGYVRVRCR